MEFLSIVKNVDSNGVKPLSLLRVLLGVVIDLGLFCYWYEWHYGPAAENVKRVSFGIEDKYWMIAAPIALIILIVLNLKMKKPLPIIGWTLAVIILGGILLAFLLLMILLGGPGSASSDNRKTSRNRYTGDQEQSAMDAGYLNANEAVANGKQWDNINNTWV